MEESSQENKGDILSDYYSGYQELELQAAEGEVKKARNALFVIAGLTLVVTLFTMNIMDKASLIISLALAALFAGLALLTKKQPFAAIITGLIVYVGLWILNIVILGVEQLYAGILVKGIVLYFLIKGLKHAREAERLRKEMRKQ